MQKTTVSRAWVYVFKTDNNQWVLLNRWDERVMLFNDYQKAVDFGDNNQHLIDKTISENLRDTTARMLEIEKENMVYNEVTNFGEYPERSQTTREQIESLLAEWDILKAQRLILKQSVPTAQPVVYGSIVGGKLETKEL